VTGCDLEQSFNSITTLKIKANVDLRFVDKRIVMNVCHFCVVSGFKMSQIA